MPASPSEQRFWCCCVVSTGVTFRPKLGLQVCFMGTHQMVRQGPFLVRGGSTVKEPHCSGRLRKSHPGASVKGSLFQKLLKPEPQPSGTAVSVLPLWERCRAFQRHSRSGGKFKPGWPLARSLPFFSLIQLKGHLKGCLFKYKHPRQRALLSARLLGYEGLNSSRGFTLHVAGCVSIMEACNLNRI